MVNTKCKNCGCNIILERDTDGWQHYPVKGDLDFCKYYGKECDCGCKNPEPIIKQSEKAVKTCATKHVIPPKSKDSGILPNFT